jgi:hypothetical protein
MRALLVLLVVLASVGCGNKPTEEQCKKAIANIQKLSGIDSTTDETETLAAIRKCRGQSTREAADCMINAKSLDELDGCEAKKK